MRSKETLAAIGACWSEAQAVDFAFAGMLPPEAGRREHRSKLRDQENRSKKLSRIPLIVPHIVECADMATRCGVGHGGASSCRFDGGASGGVAGAGAVGSGDEADRARAVVLSINGWTSGQIARAFGVTPDSVRRWRSWFAESGVDGLRASARPG